MKNIYLGSVDLHEVEQLLVERGGHSVSIVLGNSVFPRVNFFGPADKLLDGLIESLRKLRPEAFANETRVVGSEGEVLAGKALEEYERGTGGIAWKEEK